MLSIAITGCATLAGDTVQPITVITTCKGSTKVVEAVCTLINDRGAWFVTTPGAVLVRRTSQDLSIVCTRRGESQGLLLVSSSNTGMVSNVLIGGVLGIVVDMHSGAGYDYTKEIKLELACSGL